MRTAIVVSMPGIPTNYFDASSKNRWLMYVGVAVGECVAAVDMVIVVIVLGRVVNSAADVVIVSVAALAAG